MRRMKVAYRHVYGGYGESLYKISRIDHNRTFRSITKQEIPLFLSIEMDVKTVNNETVFNFVAVSIREFLSLYDFLRRRGQTIIHKVLFNLLMMECISCKLKLQVI